MPRKRKRMRKPRRAKRRNYGRSRRTNKRSRRTSRSSRVTTGLVPKTMFRKLKYRIRAYLQLAAVTPIQYFIMRGNGPFDPEAATGGASCYDWPTIQNLYSNYICTASKISCRFGATSNLSNYRIYLKPTMSTASPTITTLDNQRNVKVKMLGTISGKPFLSMKYYMTSKRMIGRSPLTDESQLSFTNGLPGNQWYWLVAAENMDIQATQATDRVSIDLTMTYYCKFTQPFQDTLNS